MPVRVESPVFQAYCGAELPRFANRIELECAKILDYYAVPWDYEPHSFVLDRDDEGRVLSAFTPDFYLPEQDLYVEVTVMRQALVTRKNRKLRELRERFGDLSLDDHSYTFNTELTAALELGYMLDLAETIVHSALERRESRGSHQRTDHPKRDDGRFLVHSLARRGEDGTPRVDYLPVTITRWPPGERVYGR